MALQPVVGPMCNELHQAPVLQQQAEEVITQSRCWQPSSTSSSCLLA
jgi:hypothetical protein